LLVAATHATSLRVIAIDHCGRGNSDALPMDSGYAMAIYLADTEEFISRHIFQASEPHPKLDVMGTSMGGILAMYLASNPRNNLNGIFLNDIGLSLTWMSILGLYKSSQVSGRSPEPKDLATKLGVTEGAVRDVQSPHHFDLPHQKNWKGMNFAHTLSNFAGPVRLIYGSQSGVCLDDQVQEFIESYPKANVLRVEGASHPVPFTENVCEFVLSSLHLPKFSKKASDSTDQEKSSRLNQDQIQKQAQEQLEINLNTETTHPSDNLPTPSVKNWFRKVKSWFSR
jgi:pimeloyl-ACP methyl ester carboxylesterase